MEKDCVLIALVPRIGLTGIRPTSLPTAVWIGITGEKRSRFKDFLSPTPFLAEMEIVDLDNCLPVVLTPPKIQS